MYSQAEVFRCDLLLALSSLNLLMGLAFLPTAGIVFRKRNTVCFTCQTLILAHPRWERSQTAHLQLGFSPSTTLRVFRAAKYLGISSCFIFLAANTPLLSQFFFFLQSTYSSVSKASQLHASCQPAVIYRIPFYFCIARNLLHKVTMREVPR